MPRKKREDGPGALHHINNRGIAKRSVCENREDVRFFQACLARAHRLGILEIHAFCFLTNHFHLIVRSPTGELSRAMQLTVNRFVRHFNRTRRRDGSLFRGRFGSRRIWCPTELAVLVPYVDQNSKEARLVSHAEVYPYGSARLFQQESGPRWHTRELIEGLACGLSGAGSYSPSAYRESFGSELSPAELEWIELRIRSGNRGPDPLDDLIGAAPARVLDWMVRKASLADGTRPGITLVAPTAVLGVIQEKSRCDPDRRCGPRRQKRAIWPVLSIGLLRNECALTHREISIRLNRPLPTVSHLAGVHRELLVGEPEYAALAADILTKILDCMHGRAGTRLKECRFEGL